MKNKHRICRTTVLILVLCLTSASFAGCASRKKEAKIPQTDASLPPVESEDLFSDEELFSFRPSESGIIPRKHFEYPYAGMQFSLTRTILSKMESFDVTLLSKEDYNNDQSLKYAFLSRYALNAEQKERSVTAFDPDAWASELALIGTLGVFHKDALNELDSLSGCAEHKELARSKDGTYIWYLSLAKGADDTLKKEPEQTDFSMTEMLPLDFNKGKTAFSEASHASDHVGTFKTTDINGNAYTQELFGDYDLTPVNVFTTWCSSCVEEMPALEKLKKEMASKGVNVVGIVYNTLNEAGGQDNGAIDTAKQLQKKAKLSFPLLLPDAEGMNGRLKGISSFPESFFVDRDGNIVGKPYIGVHTYEEWKTLTEQELAQLKSTK